MKRNTAETRRRLLAFLGAIPVSFRSDPSKAEPKKLELSSYFHGETLPVNGAQLFADKATENSAGTIRVSLEEVPPWVPLKMMSKASTLAHYCAPDVANIEPVFGLSALPMLTATSRDLITALLSPDMARSCLQRSPGGRLRYGARFAFGQLPTSKAVHSLFHHMSENRQDGEGPSSD